MQAMYDIPEPQTKEDLELLLKNLEKIELYLGNILKVGKNQEKKEK